MRFIHSQNTVKSPKLLFFLGEFGAGTNNVKVFFEGGYNTRASTQFDSVEYTYSHSQWLFYEFVSKITNKLVKQSLRVTVYNAKYTNTYGLMHYSVLLTYN